MLVLKVAGAAAAAVVGSLAISTGRNVLQTRTVVQQSLALPSMDTTVTTVTTTFATSNTIAGLPSTLAELRSMSRSEILHLYLEHCQEPTSMDAVDGDWHGVLLKNNGLTRVTRFITNRLFGRGRRWNGKRFNVETLDGINRFEVFSQRKDRAERNKITVTLKTETEHGFDFTLQPSPLARTAMTKKNNTPKKSLVLTYAQRQGPLSLWKHMADELRILPRSYDDDSPYDILVGLGSMGWSGGVLNCSPFCLYRLRNKARPR